MLSQIDRKARRKEYSAIPEARCEKLQAAIATFGAIQLARELATSEASLHQMHTGARAINDQTARQIERVLHQATGWMDT